VPSKRRRPQQQKQSAEVSQLYDLQQQTLTAVNSLVAIQTEMLNLKREKLQMKRAEMCSKGFVQVENGNWAVVIRNSTLEE